jgi:PhoPQ-activated pathogenicity-related protein
MNAVRQSGGRALWRPGAIGSLLAAVLWLAGTPLLADPAAPVAADPLRDYVARADPATAWQERSRGSYRGAEFRELVLTSQWWRGSLWRHQLFVLRPPNAEPGRPVLLYVSGGTWRPAFLKPPDDPARVPAGIGAWASLAETLRAPVAVLMQVPFQPLFGQLQEDDLLAFTLDQYLQTGATDWPLLLPMVKATITAMDAVDQLCRQEWGNPAEGFLLAGASKRGWMTWLAAAADPRIVALAPMVFDMVHMDQQLALQKTTWGFAAPELLAYTSRQLPRRLLTPRGRQLLGIVDPWAYRDQLTQPKLIVLATNDAYWPADALNLYWDGLPGPRNVLYLPNDRHVPDGLPRLFAGLAALHRSVVEKEALPQLRWRFSAAGTRAVLRVETDVDGPRVRQARAWVARAPTRDFRGAVWRAQAMTPAPEGGYRFRAPLPGQGYLGMFGEVEFGDGRRRFPLSTGLRLFGPGGPLPPAAGE